jgi:hypothetical protein
MNALVMYDRETDTLWSQFLGEGVEGPLAGTLLEIVPAELTTWREWKQRHPNTLALDKQDSRFTHDPYTPYYSSGEAGILGERNVDDRLATKELVIGITGESGQKAYAYRHLGKDRIINDTFEERPLVIILLGESFGSAVFMRVVDSETLTFAAIDNAMRMSDVETGSIWEVATGKAVSGPMAGKQLQQVPSFASFWFAWSDFYPDTDVYAQ